MQVMIEQYDGRCLFLSFVSHADLVSFLIETVGVLVPRDHRSGLFISNITAVQGRHGVASGTLVDLPIDELKKLEWKEIPESTSAFVRLQADAHGKTIDFTVKKNG